MTVAAKPKKVIAKTGSRTVHKRSSNSRELITVIACGNAADKCIPPHFIIPGKSMKKLASFDTEEASKEESPIRGATFSVSDSG